MKHQIPNPDLFSRTEKISALLMFGALWIYLFLRAINVPLLHDEIATFFYYVQSDVYLPPKAHWDANNHVLNSMLSNWSYHLFGQSPLALRLANVLSFPLYFFGAYGIASRLKTGFLRWGLLTSFVMSGYIFEYLGECRGYGLSMSLLLIALYFIFKLIETNKHVYVLLIGVFLFLATSANLTLLISSVLIFVVLFIHTARNDLKTDRRKFFLKCFWMLLTGLPFLALVKLSFTMKALGLLYYGSKAGFMALTLPSLLNQFFGASNWFLTVVIFVFTALILLICLIAVMKKRTPNKGLLLFSFLLFGSLSCIFILAAFMGVNYPEDRTAMYLYIYFMPALLFALDDLPVKLKVLRFTGIAAFFIPIYFLLHLSITRSVFSSEERHSQRIFELINSKKSDFKFPATIGGYITQELCWYYMNNSAGGHQGRLHWSNHPGLDCDFQIMSPAFRFNPQTDAYYDSIYRDPATGLVLFERRNKLLKNLIITGDIPDTENNSSPYYTLGKYDLDSLKNHTLYVGAELSLESNEVPFESRLVAAIVNASGENIVYESISLHWLKKQYDGQRNNVLQGTLVHNVPDDAVSMTFYLWNINEKPFSIRNGKCYLYSLERDY